MSWLLDADVLSQAVKTRGNQAVIAWLRREQENAFTSSIVIAQIAFWVRTKEGKAREKLQAWLTAALRSMEGRVLSFNVAVAHVWAEQKALIEREGHAMPIEDSLIAATARRHNLTVVTGNDKDFRRTGVKVFNPFKDLPPVDATG
jgi:predicted nucleic acid-binding protein